MENKYPMTSPPLVHSESLPLTPSNYFFKGISEEKLKKVKGVFKQFQNKITLHSFRNITSILDPAPNNTKLS